MTTLDDMLALDRLADLARPLVISAAATLEFFGPQPLPGAARLRRAAEAYGLCDANGSTATGALLSPSHPIGLVASYRVFAPDVRAWGRFSKTLRTGAGVFAEVNGCGLWRYLSEHPEENGQFDQAMAAMTSLELQGLREAWDWAAIPSALDLGGGSAALLRGLPFAPDARLGVLDIPPVVDRWRGREPDIAWMQGDFRTFVPSGWQTYLMKRILYSYSDAAATEILARTADAMEPGGRLLVIEPVLRANDRTPYALLLDLEMLMLGAGRVRSRRELRKLFAGAGLVLGRVVPTPLVAIIEARKS